MSDLLAETRQRNSSLTRSVTDRKSHNLRVIEEHLSERESHTDAAISDLAAARQFSATDSDESEGW